MEPYYLLFIAICLLAILFPLVLLTVFAIKKKWKLMIMTIIISFVIIILMIFFGFFSFTYLSYYNTKLELKEYKQKLYNY